MKTYSKKELLELNIKLDNENEREIFLSGNIFLYIYFLKLFFF